MRFGNDFATTEQLSGEWYALHMQLHMQCRVVAEVLPKKLAPVVSDIQDGPQEPNQVDFHEVEQMFLFLSSIESRNAD